MKKFYLIALMAVMTLAASAQQRVVINTGSGTNLEKYDGVQCQVTANRYLFHGWNTLALPIDLIARLRACRPTCRISFTTMVRMAHGR